MLLHLEGRGPPRNLSWAQVRNTEQGTPEMGGSAGNWFLLTRGGLWGWGSKDCLGGLEQACQLVLFLWPDLGAVWTDLAYLMEKLRARLLPPKYQKSLQDRVLLGVLELSGTCSGHQP